MKRAFVLRSFPEQLCSDLSSAGLTIVANVAIATGPALLGAPRSSVINLIYYNIYKNLFSLRSQEVSILLNLP